jgi:hypothetical protein
MASKHNKHDDVLFDSCGDTFTKTEYGRGKMHLAWHNHAIFLFAEIVGRIMGSVWPISSETTMISALYLHHLSIIATLDLSNST